MVPFPVLIVLDLPHRLVNDLVDLRFEKVSENYSN